jgi:large subunit ribosomal protein L15
MTDNKRKKNSRQRGSWTHGWGAKKKHRGAGHRGGRGNAGSGKKGDAKKTFFWKDLNYFGKIGFNSINRKDSSAINLSHLSDTIETLVKKGKAEKTTSTYKIDLSKIGYAKLLGAGNISKKIEITVNEASEKAIQKVTQAGGKVILTKKVESKVKADDKKE